MQYLAHWAKNCPSWEKVYKSVDIVARLNKALDEVRAEEHRNMKDDGYEPILTKSRMRVYLELCITGACHVLGKLPEPQLTHEFYRRGI